MICMQVVEILKSLTRHGPKIQLMDPKRWDFEVFYRVISLSILVPRYGRLSKLRQRVWNVLGQELSNRQLQTFGNLLSELHFRFDESDYSELHLHFGVC